MKIKLQANDLRRVAGDCVRVAGANGATRCAKLSAGGKIVHFTATDLEVFLSQGVYCEVMDEGTVCVDAKALHDVAGKLAGEVTLAVKKELLVITGEEKYRFTLNTISADEFPVAPETKGELVRVPAASFLQAVNRALPMLSGEDSRYSVPGALVEFGKTMRVVTTSTTILSMGEFAGAGTGSAVVSEKALKLAVKIFGSDGLLNIHHDEKMMYISTGMAIVACVLLQKQFPNYKAISDKKHDKQIIVKRASIVTALSRVAPMADGQLRAVDLSIADGKIKISAENTLSGSAEDEVPCVFAGEFEISFDVRAILAVIGWNRQRSGYA